MSFEEGFQKSFAKDFTSSPASRNLSAYEEAIVQEVDRKRRQERIDLREIKKGFPVVAHLDAEQLSVFDRICAEVGCSFNDLADAILKRGLEPHKIPKLKEALYSKIEVRHGKEYADQKRKLARNFRRRKENQDGESF